LSDAQSQSKQPQSGILNQFFCHASAFSPDRQAEGSGHTAGPLKWRGGIHPLGDYDIMLVDLSGGAATHDAAQLAVTEELQFVGAFRGGRLVLSSFGCHFRLLGLARVGSVSLRPAAIL
jgi:hypothetical protein